MLLPPALVSSTYLPVSVCGTGPIGTIAAFLDSRAMWLRYFCFTPPNVFGLKRTDLPMRSLLRLPRELRLPGHTPRPLPHSSVLSGYRNLNLLSIDYGSRPRLRSRLTQGRSALPWKPWIFGLKDSHLHLATHSVILSSIQSTAPCGTASSRMQCSSTDVLGTSLSFGGVFEPRTFSAQDLSTSELLRTL